MQYSADFTLLRILVLLSLVTVASYSCERSVDPEKGLPAIPEPVVADFWIGMLKLSAKFMVNGGW